MKKRLAWMLILVGLVLGAGVGTPFLIQKEPAFAMGETARKEAAATGSSAQADGMPGQPEVKVAAAVYTTETPAPAGGSFSSYGKPAALPFRLVSVNGVSLADDIKTVYEIKGTPLSVKQDEILSSKRTYKFEDCEIGMSDGAITFVKVPAAAKQIEIDGQLLPMRLDELKSRLGKPYFKAEDGIVYKAGYHALKLFLDQETGDLTSVHFFAAAGQ